MKPTAWLAMAGCLVLLVSCGKKSEPADVPAAPVAQVAPVVEDEPEPAVGGTDLTPPPAEPPPPVPDEEEPSVPDSEAAPD
jgi:hypothetical protein